MRKISAVPTAVFRQIFKRGAILDNNNFQINVPAEGNKSLKSEVFKSSLGLGLLLGLYVFLQKPLISLFKLISYPIVTGKFTFSMDVVNDYLKAHESLIQSTTFRMGLNAFVTGIDCIIIVLLCIIFKITDNSFFKPSAKKAGEGAKWFPACYLVNILITFIGSFLIMFLSQSGISVPEADFTIKNPTAAALILQFGYSVILAPIIEEFIYRGLILSVLAKYSKTGAVFLSALAFGLMHGNIPQAISAFFTGLLFATIAMKYHSIIPSIVIHMLNNLLSSASDFNAVYDLPHYQTVYAMIVISLAFIGLYLLCTKLKELNITNDKSLPISNKEVCKSIFLNPAILLYLLYLVYSIVIGLLKAN